MDEFAAPGTVSPINYAERIGHLLVIEPLMLEVGIMTSVSDQPKDAMRANVLDVTAGEALYDVLIFPAALVGSLKSRIGQKVLGTLGQGVARTKGHTAPWQLTDMSHDQQAKASASAFIKSLATGNQQQFAAPTTTDQAQRNLESVFGGNVKPPF